MKSPISILVIFACAVVKSDRGVSCEGLDFFNQWVRPPISGMEITAGYFSVENRNQYPLEINSLTSTTLKSVTLHETIYDNGLMKMRPVPVLTVPPESTVRAEPGGLHLMLEGDFTAHNEKIDIVFKCGPDSLFVTFPFTANGFHPHDP